MTYFQVLKNSFGLIKAGFPGATYWSKTLDEAKWMFEGFKGVLFQLLALILWILLLLSFPISLPILSFFSYRYRKTRLKKALARRDELVDRLHGNKKNKGE